ncbi:hypothetical protein DFJ74DRAFT_655558 [Hyaloraphidium curvatum]|nr:hypothetical protein DFJ74DRAFT_655558 [Hyaloraphidium curvatum]
MAAPTRLLLTLLAFGGAVYFVSGRGQALPPAPSDLRTGTSFDPFAFAADLYAKYGAEITAMVPRMAAFCKRPGVQCLSNDLETEIAYMRVRHFKPKTVWEASPRFGYSTTWLLAALAKNAAEGSPGHLWSFDIENVSVPHVDKELAQRWTFVKGTFQKSLERSQAENWPRPDLVHLDSQHSFQMAHFYIGTLFPFLLASKKHVAMSLHDVYNPMFWTDFEPNLREEKKLPSWMANEEGQIVVDYLAYLDPPEKCRLFTFAQERQKARQTRLVDVRREKVGKATPFGETGVNIESTIFWEFGC